MATRSTPAEVKALFEKFSNWGRWGKDDERGALNFITDAKARRRRPSWSKRRDGLAGACRLRLPRGRQSDSRSRI